MLAVTSTPLLNFPGKPWCILAPRIGVESKGPALKIRVLAVFELHVKFCFYCTEWPTNSDWPSRPRYWPCIADAQRIMSLGCHVVAKSAPRDKENKSWRFSFSVAECEQSKLVPDTATKCFLALKIILRDHLQPVVSEIGSYHIKTIFLNTMEKLPVGFWADENIEKCFLTLLTELHIALGMMKCPHHWFSSINFICFQFRLRSCNSLLRISSADNSKGSISVYLGRWLLVAFVILCACTEGGVYLPGHPRNHCRLRRESLLCTRQ